MVAGPEDIRLSRPSAYALPASPEALAYIIKRTRPLHLGVECQVSGKPVLSGRFIKKTSGTRAKVTQPMNQNKSMNACICA